MVMLHGKLFMISAQEDLNLKLERKRSFFKWIIPAPFFLHFRLFNTVYNIQLIVNIIRR